MRRRLVLGASVAAVAAALGLQFLKPSAPAGPPVVATEPGRLLALIGREFGEVFVADEEAKAFADEFSAAHAGRSVPETEVIFAFIRATNVIRALETGEGLTYVGLDELRTAPCRNTLSSWWL